MEASSKRTTTAVDSLSATIGNLPDGWEMTMNSLIRMVTLGSAIALSSGGEAPAADKPTVVLVHGAFANPQSWDGVAAKLRKDGYPVYAPVNPLRSVAGDAAELAKFVKTLKGAVVLVGHSYGGEVISEAATESSKVKALVFVAAFAPDKGESAIELSGKFPGGTLGNALSPPVDIPGGGKDLFIDKTKFHDQFAADVPEKTAAGMAEGQRPVTQAALEEKATSPAWKNIPSWFVYGDADKNIPPKAMGWMAERAKSKETIVVKGGSHSLMVSHPDVVAKIIEDAASGKAGR